MSESIIPFSCGTQYLDWQEANCERCTKGVTYDDKGNPRPFTCDIQAAISRGALTGRVSLPIAERMGALRYRGRYCWPCNEWEPAEENET